MIGDTQLMGFQFLDGAFSKMLGLGAMATSVACTVF
jgi:hypothetical protein